jgi:hypothetical protein
MPRTYQQQKKLDKKYIRVYKTLARDYEVERVPHPTLKNTWVERKKQTN